MQEALSPNEGPDIKLARRYGLDDNQIEALGGMGSIVPRYSLWKFKGKSPDKIRNIVFRYAPNYLIATQIFVDALNEGGFSLQCANKQLAKLTRLAIEKDLEIEKKLAIQNLSPESPHPDSSI